MKASCNQRAAVLVLVLWAIVVLSLLASGLSFVLRQDLAIANIEKERVAAHWLARAGVEQAIAELTEDTADIDTLNDRWSDNEEAFRDVELTGGTFRVMRDDWEDTPAPIYGIADESAKLNVNVATREQLMKLPQMTEAIAAAILDWRDADEQPQPDGVEAGHYTSAAHPYKIRNGPLRTVRELLLVRDVTPELFYGEDANGNGLLDPNENDGDTSQPADNSDGQLQRGWLAYLTTCSYDKNVSAKGEKRLNINKATAGELSQRLNLESWAAESIFKAREKKAFEHLVDLLNVRRDPEVKGDSGSGTYTRSGSEQDQPVTPSIFKQIAGDITLKDDQTLPGRINVNTAPHAVLVTLPGIDDDVADAIIHSRNAGQGYASIGHLLDVSGLTAEKLGKIEDLVTVRSNVFRILGTGRTASGIAQVTTECIVDRGGPAPRVLYWLESSP